HPKVYRSLGSGGNVEPVMHRSRGAGRNLVIVQGREYVLWIPAIDAMAVAVQHVDIDIMRPAIHLTSLVRIGQGAIAGKRVAVGRSLEISPDFVGVDSALRQWMAYEYRPHHHFDQVGRTRLQFRQLRP